MKLLIVDGSNMVIRAALGDKIQPEHAAHNASNIIRRGCADWGITHMVIALDTPGVPSWRCREYPEYKANRDGSTAAWIHAAHTGWSRMGWYVTDYAGFEADDLIATLAVRAKDRAEVLVMSGDSDLQPLTGEGIGILKPMDGGRFELWGSADVCKKHMIATPAGLLDLKAMAGEAGDNVPGVDGIGRIRAQALLAQYKSLDGVIEAGRRAACSHSLKVARSEAMARLSYKLVTLHREVPVGMVRPSECLITKP